MGEEATAIAIWLEVDPATFKAGGFIVGEGDETVGSVIDMRGPCVAGENASFDEDLEAIADAEDRTAVGDEGVHIFAEDVSDVGGPENASAEVIAIREAAGDDEHVVIAEVAVAIENLVHMDDFGLAASELAGEGGVTIAVGAVGVKDKDFGCFAEHGGGVTGGGGALGGDMLAGVEVAAPGLFDVGDGEVE